MCVILLDTNFILEKRAAQKMQCAIQVRKLTKKKDHGHWECRLTRTDKQGRTREFSTTYDLDVVKGTIVTVPPTPPPTTRRPAPTREPRLIAVAFDPNDPEDKREALEEAGVFEEDDYGSGDQYNY